MALPPIDFRPTTYQDFVTRCRRFDRDASLLLLSELSRRWDGATHDEYGNLKALLPWDIAAVSAVLICRGTTGGTKPTVADIDDLCRRVVQMPQPGPLEGVGDLMRGLARHIYQQVPYQRSGLQQWARPIAIYADTRLAPGYEPRVMSGEWEAKLLGCTIREFVSIGFCLWAAVLNGSRYPFPWDDRMLELLALHGGQERFDAVVREHFATDIASFKRERMARLEAGGGTPGQKWRREPFAYNPLVARPMVGGVLAGEWIAPCVPTLELRVSELGILYGGLDRWGEAFTQDAGHRFEQYVGRQLAELAGADVVSEVTYREGGNSKLSIDWFVILPDAVILVECKNSVPTAAVREGLEAFEGAHRRLNKAIHQINATARLIAQSRPEFDAIPKDRPLIGAVVTLGDWPFASDPWLREQMTESEIPTAVVSVEYIEELVTLSPDSSREFVRRATRATHPKNVVEPRALIEGLPSAPNPILEAAFESVPVIAYMGDVEVEK